MRNFDRQVTWRSIAESRPVLMLLGIVILVFAWSVIRFWSKMEDTERNRRIAEERVMALRDKKVKLTQDISDLNTDEGKEKFFRENYGLAKEGEEVIVVVEDQKEEKAPERLTLTSLIDFLKGLFK